MDKGEQEKGRKPLPIPPKRTDKVRRNTYLVIAVKLPYLERRVRDGGDNAIGLGLQVVDDEVRRAAQRNLPDRPRSIVGEDRGQQTDPKGVLRGRRYGLRN